MSVSPQTSRRRVARSGTPGRGGPALRLLLAVALTSAALIAYEIVLMRQLLIESWHHFGYLVISVALLGFGASGVLLALVDRSVRRHPLGWMLLFVISLVMSLLWLPRMARLLPVSAQFIPDDLWSQVGWWSLYWLAAAVPFFLGAAFIGLTLMVAGQHAGRVYAANLMGSALGAIGAILVVSRFALPQMHWPPVGLAIVSAALLASMPRVRSPVALVTGVVVTLAGLAVGVHIAWPLVPNYDQHKYAARLQQLVIQGSAERVATEADPHGHVALYASELFHDLPFLALAEAPPPMYSLVINGDPGGSVLRISGPEQAGIMDRTLMALPYRLAPDRPRVLLLGETDGVNVWLARRRAARDIHVVQPNTALLDLVRRFGGGVFEGPSVQTFVQDGRAFVEQEPSGNYHILQVVSLEGLGMGGAGARGLAEDHLATVQGFAQCLKSLDEDGLLTVSRGIQQPPRENIRIFATLVAALESLGVQNPERHMIQVRDYLGVCTMALRSPLTAERRARLEQAIGELNLTPVWYDGLPVEYVNNPDALSGPAGSRVDWLHHAASEILSTRRHSFFESWMFDVRPATDDSPFFWDFYKDEAIGVLRQAYGPLWLTRAAMGRLFLYASLVIGGATGVVLILMPLSAIELGRVIKDRVGQRRRDSFHWPTTFWTVVYFTCLGLGFMGIEMALISRAIHYLGDPVIASAAVIGAVLAFSGIGSAVGPRWVGPRIWVAPLAVAVAALLLRWVGWVIMDAGIGAIGLLSGVGLMMAFLMGIPMPVGLNHLNRYAKRLTPWAWGVNGVASVVATSTAIVLAMVIGYRAVMLASAACYAVAGLSGLLMIRTMSPRDQGDRHG
ncbi:MAG: hypothetical protein IID37_16185 [Planctomycetes bacterium]|nr:hypothetical protein [Planctomycetota bacterium]